MKAFLMLLERLGVECSWLFQVAGRFYIAVADCVGFRASGCRLEVWGALHAHVWVRLALGL